MDQAENLREMMRSKRPPGRALRVIGVASGKGGVGKTNVSANLAVLASRAGNRVLVIDGDMGLANIELIYGIKPHAHLGHLIDDAMPLRDVVTPGPEGVRVLSAGRGVQALTALDSHQRLRLVTALDAIEDEYDVVFLDAGAGIGDNVLFFAGAAQETLLVVSPEPTSLTDAYATIKVLCSEAGVRNFNVVVNMSPNEAIARDIFARLVQVASRFLDARVRFLGWIPRDENVHRAVMSQRPLVSLFPASPASRALIQISDTLLHEPPPKLLDGGLKFLWNRLHREAQ